MRGKMGKENKGNKTKTRGEEERKGKGVREGRRKGKSGNKRSGIKTKGNRIHG